MSNISQVKKESNWGDASTTINSNFQNLNTDLEKVKSSTTKFKGYFTSESSLKDKFPSPQSGDTAWVGEPYPGKVYDVQSGQWHNTNADPDTGSVELNDYVNKTEFEENKQQQDEKFTELDDGKLNRDNTGQSTVKDSSDAFYFCDSQGNIVGKLDKDGLKAIEYFLKDGKKLSEVLLSKLNNDNDSESKLRDSSDTFIFCDSKGNVICQILKDGVKSSDFILKDGTKVSESLAGKVDKEEGKGLSSNDFTDSYKQKIDDMQVGGGGSGGQTVDGIIDRMDGFYFCDGNGNVILKITADGIYIKDGMPLKNNGNVPTSCVYGKRLYTLCDSLGTSNVWQNKFAEMTGCIFDGNENYSPVNAFNLSEGGTRTLGNDRKCGQMRALKLLELHPDADVIFYENVNDTSAKRGAISDAPFMLSQMVDYDGHIYGSQEEAREALAAVIGTVEEQKVGTMVRIPYTSENKDGYLLTVNGTAVSDGSIQITMGSNRTGIAVTTSMSVGDILNEILRCDFIQYGYEDMKKGDNSILFSNVGNGGTVTFDDGGTGVSATLASDYSSSYEAYCFISRDVNQWNTVGNWKKWDEITLQSAVKGILEFLTTNFPKAQIYYLLLPDLSVGDSTPKREDGTVDIDSIASLHSWSELYDTMQEIAGYMWIPSIRLGENCGINPYNASSGGYYPYNGGVHPYEEGYKRWGEQLARIF